MDGVTLASDAPGTLTVSWETPSLAPTDYRLRWAPVESGFLSWKDDNETDRGNAYPAGDATSLTLSGLPEGTEFKVQLRARYHKGGYKKSPWSGPWAEASALVMSQPPQVSAAPATLGARGVRDALDARAPAAPNLAGAAVTPAGDVMVVWLNPADDSITGYQVLRGPDAASLAVIEEDAGSSGTSYTDTAPPAGQTHTYAVKARNATGLSPLSNTVTATVPAAEDEEEELVTAQQNSDAVLVSNFGQTDAENAEVRYFEGIGQPFVAGPSLAGFGYRIQGIRVSAAAGEVGGMIRVPTGQAVVREDVNGNPGDNLVVLTVPDDFASTTDLMEYTLSAPPGTVLRGGAKYWVVLAPQTANSLFLSATTSPDEDQAPPPLDGWRIDDERYLDTLLDFVSHPQPIKLAVLGSPGWVTIEPTAIDEDFPGADYNAHETRGVVIPGTDSTGQLTTGLDRNHGQTGDYWYLHTKPGRSYRVEVTFGNDPNNNTGGSAGIAFLDPDGVDYASSCCESDHNRDDGATFLHFTHSHQPREKNRRYMVELAAFDLYNEGTRVYNGPYTIQMTDITGVKEMVSAFTGGVAVTSSTALVAADGDSVDLGSKFTTGAHTAGYLLDRIDVLLFFGAGGAAVPAISLHPNSSSGPGTKLCDLTVPDRVVQSPVVWSYPPPYTFLAPDCADVTLTANTPYWIVFSDMNRVDYTLRVSSDAEVRDYGSGWMIDGFAKRGTSNVWSDVNWLTRIGLWAMEK